MKCNGRRSRTMRLDARVRRGGGGTGWYRFGAVVLLITTLGGLGGVLYAGALMTHKALFTHNDRFRIQAIDIRAGRVKTEAMIREYLAYVDIKAGSNLFAFDIRELVDLYLDRNPLVKSLRVERVLPGVLRVELRERDPLARMGQRGSLVTDREGFVFHLSSDLHRLPVIVGDKDPGLVPGRTVSGMAKAAIEVLTVCDNPRIGLRVVGIDVSFTDYLLVHMLTPDGIKEARLAWNGMGSGSTRAREDLLLRLSRLRQVAQRDKSGHTEYDATLPGRVYVR